MKGARILLVDDEEDFTENMSRLLKNRGYLAKVVNSGDGAIQALDREKFDVMVLDLKMPGMDGMTTLKEVKKLNLFVETLILTGHGTIETTREALKLGAYDFLTKPCEIDELVEKIEGAWRKKTDEEKQAMLESINKIVDGKGF